MGYNIRYQQGAGASGSSQGLADFGEGTTGGGHSNAKLKQSQPSCELTLKAPFAVNNFANDQIFGPAIFFAGIAFLFMNAGKLKNITSSDPNVVIPENIYLGFKITYATLSVLYTILHLYKYSQLSAEDKQAKKDPFADNRYLDRFKKTITQINFASYAMLLIHYGLKTLPDTVLSVWTAISMVTSLCAALHLRKEMPEKIAWIGKASHFLHDNFYAPFTTWSGFAYCATSFNVLQTVALRDPNGAFGDNTTPGFKTALLVLTLPVVLHKWYDTYQRSAQPGYESFDFEPTTCDNFVTGVKTVAWDVCKALFIPLIVDYILDDVASTTLDWYGLCFMCNAVLASGYKAYEAYQTPSFTQ